MVVQIQITEWPHCTLGTYTRMALGKIDVFKYTEIKIVLQLQDT
jgi:hypothetical protein